MGARPREKNLDGRNFRYKVGDLFESGRGHDNHLNAVRFKRRAAAQDLRAPSLLALQGSRTMKPRRQNALRAYPRSGNPFHQKVCARVAALESEGWSQSEALLHLLMHQVLSETEKEMLGLVTKRQRATERETFIALENAPPQIASSPAEGAPVIIPDSAVNQLLCDTKTNATVSDRNLTESNGPRDEPSLSMAKRWGSFGRSTKPTGSD